MNIFDMTTRRSHGYGRKLMAWVGAVCLVLLAGHFIVPGARAAEPAAAPPGTMRTKDTNTNRAVGRDNHADHGEHDEHADAAKHEDHDGHAEEEAAHTVHAATPAHDDHEDHEGHAADGAPTVAEKGQGEHKEDEHGEEAGLTLSPAERRNAGVVVATAGPGELRREIGMPGEVVLNEDRVAHVVPLVGGITRAVGATVGDQVEAGGLLAVVESNELGAAKLEYLTKVNELLSRNLLAPRARAVHENTVRLLAFLDGKPPLDQLQSFQAGEAGENLKTLIASYAEATTARQAYEREKGLYDKQIASEQDYLAAKADYEKAAAEFMTDRDSIAFEVKRALIEVEAGLRAVQFEVRTADQRLRLMGIGEEDIHALDALAGPEDGGVEDSRAEEREHYFGNGFARYEIRSPISGTVVEKHIVLGENVGGETAVFTVADLKTVWVNLTVHLKDLHAVRAGEEVTIRAEHSGHEARGRIAMVSPLVDEATRTATARVVLDNDDGSWRPGVFVVGRVGTAAERMPVVVPKDAVQTVAGKPVVFVVDGEHFEPVPVRTGRSDSRRVEIVAGLSAGTSYVAEGAFEIKAKLVTSSLGSHAGHGH